MGAKIYLVVEERGSLKREIIELPDDADDVVSLVRRRRGDLVAVFDTRAGAERLLTL